MFDSDLLIGLLLGIAIGAGIGIGIGISTGRRNKPWSELNEREKRVRIIAIVTGSVLFIAGVVIFFIRLLS